MTTQEGVLRCIESPSVPGIPAWTAAEQYCYAKKRKRARMKKNHKKVVFFPQYVYIYTRMQQPTAKQRRILGFIEQYRKKHGISPSFQEIQAHFGYASVNSVQNHVRFLRNKGLLGSRQGTSGTKKRSLMSLVPAPLTTPLVGRIAAGVPVEAVENVETSIDLTSLGVDNSACRSRGHKKAVGSRSA
jgi:hypothetical protein